MKKACTDGRKACRHEGRHEGGRKRRRVRQEEIREGKREKERTEIKDEREGRNARERKEKGNTYGRETKGK